MQQKKIYPESGVELNPFISKHYDRILATASAGRYQKAIKRALKDMDIQAGDHILDLGCGTGSNTREMLRYLGPQGRIQGLDISKQMAAQFEKRFETEDRVHFQSRRVDLPIQLEERFDKVFISFVIHGFPHEVRFTVIRNALNHLKEGGSFFILDFSEFDMDAMPFHHRALFKAVECKYAFDYIKRDWKGILKEQGFGDFGEHFYLKNYVRLLRANKPIL